MVKMSLDEKIGIIKEKVDLHRQKIIDLKNTIAKLQEKKFQKPTYFLRLNYRENCKTIEFDKDVNAELVELLKFDPAGYEDENSMKIFERNLMHVPVGTSFLIRGYFKDESNMTENTPRYIQFIKVISQNPLKVEKRMEFV